MMSVQEETQSVDIKQKSEEVNVEEMQESTVNFQTEGDSEQKREGIATFGEQDTLSEEIGNTRSKNAEEEFEKQATEQPYVQKNSNERTETAAVNEESEQDAPEDGTGSGSVNEEQSILVEEQLDEEEPDNHPLDELTDQQVVDLVQEIETENRHLYLENILFESFLKDNDPSLLEGLDNIMDFLLGRSSVSAKETFNKYKLDSYTSITFIAEGKGPKINLSQKTDMVMRAMEDNQTSLEAFLKKCHITKRNLKSELEEFAIREAEIKEAMDIFEYNVVIQGLDQLTQRIPAEKFVRYMEEWLKSAQLQIEKLRLRIATLKVQYKKVSQQLIQRQELGENVHAVDFDQLEIENKHFVEKIEQKNLHLIELKKMNGGANLVLSTHKKFLQKQQENCNKLKAEIEERNKQITETEAECEKAEEELAVEIERYETCKNLKNRYTVPDVMEYVRLKGRLHELRKNIKIWMRRRKIQDIALSTCLREMKNLTGVTYIDPAWFDDLNSMSEDSVSDDML